MATSNAGMSEDTKTIITVILLLFAFPIGIFFVWFWVKWPKWVKWLITIPPVLVFVTLILGSILPYIMYTH